MGIETFPIFNCDELSRPFAEWKTLTRAAERLDPLCAQLGVKSLESGFVNGSRQEAIRVLGAEEITEIEADMNVEFRDGGYYLPTGELMYATEEQWFEPSQGLETVNSLLCYLEKEPSFWSEEEIESGKAEEWATSCKR